MHYTLLVIGENPEELLAPYQENNMGDCPKEYLEFKDVENDLYNMYMKGGSLEFSTHFLRELKLTDEQLWELTDKGSIRIPDMDAELFTTLELGKPYSIRIKKLFPGTERAIRFLDDKVETKLEEVSIGGMLKTYIIQAKEDDDIGDLCFKFIAGETIIGEEDKNPRWVNLVIELIDAPKTIPHKEKYKDLEEFAREYCAMKRDKETGKYGYWWNPNSKWDWYQIGGRWPGSFKLKKEVVMDMAEKGKAPIVGNGGIFKITPRFDSDQAYKGDIDWKGMEPTEDEIHRVRMFWRLYVLDGEPMNKEEEKLKKEFENGLNSKPECLKAEYEDEDAYVAYHTGFSTYAVLTEDGKWHEPGPMGWFSSDAENGAKKKFRASFFETFIEPLTDDTLLTLVDCHI